MQIHRLSDLKSSGLMLMGRFSEMTFSDVDSFKQWFILLSLFNHEQYSYTFQCLILLLENHIRRTEEQWERKWVECLKGYWIFFSLVTYVEEH